MDHRDCPNCLGLSESIRQLSSLVDKHKAARDEALRTADHFRMRCGDLITDPALRRIAAVKDVAARLDEAQKALAATRGIVDGALSDRDKAKKALDTSPTGW